MEITQTMLWNGRAGQAWVDAQALLDHMFQPFADQLVAAAASAGPRVIDVGCGTGATTLAIARRLGAAADCLGVDISAPMIALARERAAAEGSPAQFACADAQDHTFAPAHADIVVSRFGVMFFTDPVAAFANLLTATRAGGRLHAIVWRGAAENPFMTTAERAAAPFLPAVPRRADGPGQFALAEPARVKAILGDGGWTGVELEPLDVTCRFPASDLERYVTRLGPLGVALPDVDAATRTAVVAAVLAAFAPFIDGDQVRFTAACWTLRAHAPT
jgi:SAM-dependent methyltransferase